MAANNDLRLISAVWNKNIVECRRLIDTGEAKVNGDRDQDGCSALHRVSLIDYVEISVFVYEYTFFTIRIYILLYF